ncbi:hypothetical protein GCM10027286_12950 [Virgibacillus ainsalahensis]
MQEKHQCKNKCLEEALSEIDRVFLLLERGDAAYEIEKVLDKKL